VQPSEYDRSSHLTLRTRPISRIAAGAYSPHSVHQWEDRARPGAGSGGMSDTSVSDSPNPSYPQRLWKAIEISRIRMLPSARTSFCSPRRTYLVAHLTQLRRVLHRIADVHDSALALRSMPFRRS